MQQRRAKAILEFRAAVEKYVAAFNNTLIKIGLPGITNYSTWSGVLGDQLTDQQVRYFETPEGFANLASGKIDVAKMIDDNVAKQGVAEASFYPGHTGNNVYGDVVFTKDTGKFGKAGTKVGEMRGYDGFVLDWPYEKELKARSGYDYLQTFQRDVVPRWLADGTLKVVPSNAQGVVRKDPSRNFGQQPQQQDVAEAIPVIRGTQPTGAQYANQLAKIAMKLAKQRDADGLRNDAKDFNKAAKLFAAGDVDGGAEIIAYEMDTEPADEFYAYMEHYKIPTEIVFGLNESQTDYTKRRQRYDDVEAGRPVKPVHKNPQTDYAKKRAKDKRDMELGETTNYWTRLQNERNTKIASLVNELKESIEKK
jgi:hypothetical protein